jgi:hypothetical protein
MQKYEEGYDKYAPQSCGGRAAPKAGGVHHPLTPHTKHIKQQTKNLFESMDFEESESVMWRKVNLPIYFLCLMRHLPPIVVAAPTETVFSR